MSEVNWRRMLAISFLFICLTLIVGSIYLHLKQKHHFGRLQYQMKNITTMAKLIDRENRNSSVLSKYDDGPASLSEVCLQCICDTATECKPVNCYGNIGCGLYRISRPYWSDAGKPILEGDKSQGYVGDDDNNVDLNNYNHCVTNPYCAARTVKEFINLYERDCNQDGIIDCRDHIALHIMGPTGCILNEMQVAFKIRMDKCFMKYQMTF